MFGLGGGGGVAGGGVRMATVVTCVFSTSRTADDDAGHVQVGGWGHFSKVLYKLLRRISKVSPSSYDVQPFTRGDAFRGWIPDLAYFDTENCTVYHKNT